MSEPFHFEEREGVLAGPVRTPRNTARNLGAGSIHDDATAQKLGFRGGTVAGSLHMEQFPPLLIEVFGPQWLERGGLSLYFRHATTDDEPVQAFACRPSVAGTERVEVCMVDAAANRVCEGTATLGGPDPESTVRQRVDAIPEPRDIRILAEVERGAVGKTVPTRVSRERLERRLDVITEPLPAYTDPSRYGGCICTPALQVQILRPAEASILPRNSDFGVGLFGAIELQLVRGPVLVEHDYEAQARVLGIGETPKTEYIYYAADLRDASDGTHVLQMIMMLRFMKASSRLWQ